MSQTMFECLTKAKTLREGLNMYQDILEQEYLDTGNSKTREKKSAVRYYTKSIFNKTLIASYRTNFNKLYDVYDKQIPEMLFDLDGNKKAAKSFIEKINKLQSENRSLDASYKDIHRFRLTVTNSSKDSSETIQLLRKATLVTIKYFCDNGFILCQPNRAKDTKGFVAEEHPEVYVPSEDIIPKEYKSLVKNYVNSPKKKGYQGIHLFFADDKNNQFEVQLRTLAMDIRATHGSARQEKFKEETRDVKKWDLKQIAVENFEYLEIKSPETGEIEEEVVIDKAGIIKPTVTFLRRKTFQFFL